ncbi:MAG: T9SS type A sorting domain-containing protein [candidate division Zixibacteria bacterium]|nr:T9SS type A sorting domain-containing protein [candidate division Zixibacteria bacterium]
MQEGNRKGFWKLADNRDAVQVGRAAPTWLLLWLDDGYRGDLEGTSYSCAMGTGIAAGCMVMLEGPYEGIDHDVRECIHHGGANWPGYPDEKWGYGTEYYDKALDRAMEIRDGGGDGGSRPLAAAAPALRLAQNAPNPATSSTTIRLELSSREVTRAEVAIYDLSGRRVRAFDVPVRDGLAEVAWDLTTSGGARVAPGVYIYRVSAGGLAAAKKCVVH